MNLLLDTHILLWSLADPQRISVQVRSAVASPRNRVWVSAISIWEIFVKEQIGKLKVPDGLQDAAEAQGFEFVNFTVDHAKAVSGLPLFHRDPFDRALIAQAKFEGFSFVTADSNLFAYRDQVNLFSG